MSKYFGREPPGFKNLLAGATVLFALATMVFLIVASATHWYVQIRPATADEVDVDLLVAAVRERFSWRSLTAQQLSVDGKVLREVQHSYEELGLSHLLEHYRVCVALVATACACAGLCTLLLLLLSALLPLPRSRRPPTRRRARVLTLLSAFCLLVACCCVVFTVAAVVYHTEQPSALRSDLDSSNQGSNSTGDAPCVMACASFCDGEDGAQWRPDAGWAVAVCSLSLSSTLVLMCVGLLVRSLRRTYHNNALPLYDELSLGEQLLVTNSLFQGQDIALTSLRGHTVFGVVDQNDEMADEDQEYGTAATTAMSSPENAV
jgi:hypothetical protein